MGSSMMSRKIMAVLGRREGDEVGYEGRKLVCIFFCFLSRLDLVRTGWPAESSGRRSGCDEIEEDPKWRDSAYSWVRSKLEA